MTARPAETDGVRGGGGSAARNGGRSGSRGRTVVAGLVLGAAAMVVGSAPWVRAVTSSAVEAHVGLSVAGSVVAPAVNAGGLVVLAASCALALAGTWGRRFAAAGVMLGGVLVTASGIAGTLDPQAAALSAARAAVGVAVLDGPVTTTPMPWLAVLLGVLVVVLGLRTVVVTGRWTAPSARHERTPPAEPDAWDALSRGQDPS